MATAKTTYRISYFSNKKGKRCKKDFAKLTELKAFAKSKELTDYEVWVPYKAPAKAKKKVS